MEKFKKKLVEMCKVNVKAAVVFIILALFLALLGIGDSEGDVYLLAAGIFAFVAILMFGTAGTKKKRIKAQLREMEEEGSLQILYNDFSYTGAKFSKKYQVAYGRRYLLDFAAAKEGFRIMDLQEIHNVFRCNMVDGEPQETIYIALETADGSRTLVGSAAKMTEEFSGIIANLKQITRLNGGAQWQ